LKEGSKEGRKRIEGRKLKDVEGREGGRYRMEVEGRNLKQRS
jgi:hypothetical protein